MFKNYFKIAIRNLSRNKSYATINIIGLAVAIAACLLIFLLIQFETSFDNFHKNKDRIYRIVSVTKTPDGTNYSRGNAFPVAQGLRIDYPQLESVARIYFEHNKQITVIGDKSETVQKKFEEKRLFFAEPQFFEIFNFPFLAGNPKTALSEPNTALLTQQTAEKYFGDWHAAINKYIKYDNRKVCKVTGILKNMPSNTDFPLQVVLSFKTSENDTSSDWVSTRGNLNTFVVLPRNMSAQLFNNTLQTFAKQHKPNEYANQGYMLQPLTEIHYDSRFGTFNKSTFGKELITALSLIGMFLLVIACVNFINLATAQAVNRSKEVGVRKVIGSSKKQLVIQFLSESFLIVVVAVSIGVAIASVTLPLLNKFLETFIRMSFDVYRITFLIAVIIVVTILSGLYPAVVISKFNPITALKSKSTNRSAGSLSLRRVLVILQFTIAQTLIIGTLVIIHQMDFFRNASMGFDKDAIVTVPIPNDSISQSKISALKSQLLQKTGIKNVSFSTFSPADNIQWDSDFKFENNTKATDFNADLKWADADYFKTYNIKFIAGRPYEEADTVRELVVNETMLEKLGIRNPQDILDKKINLFDGKIVALVVGVIKDFHSTSLAKSIKPTILGSWKEAYKLINIKIQPQNAKQTLAGIEKLWSNTYPDYIYQYQFLDDKIASFYKQEDQLSQLYKIFAGIAIIISCLGLYGLISFMAVKRRKEVGVRKVLGATVSNIIYLFSKEFILLIAIAFLIATPIAYYFMHQWLQNFVYRINIEPGIFILTILISVFISALTVGYQAIKAAVANPVKSLRTE